MKKRGSVQPTSTWAKFLTQIDSARASMGFLEGEECYYRGHADATWTLQPSIFRLNGLNQNQIRSLETDLFFEFQAKARELYDPSLTGWDILFLMQHHGVRTRLLDWTEVFGVALFFAVQGDQTTGDSCIWLMNPYSLNAFGDNAWDRERDLMSPKYLGYDAVKDAINDYEDLLLKNGGIDWEAPVALYPTHSNPRIRAQCGSFTIHGLNPKPIEVIARQYVKKVVLPPALVLDARRFLESAGINAYSAFPDLDGLARMLANKYGIGAAGRQAFVRQQSEEVRPRVDRLSRETKRPRKRDK